MANPLTDWLEGGDRAWDRLGDQDVRSAPDGATADRDPLAEGVGRAGGRQSRDYDERDRPGRRRALIALAVAPWAVVAVVAVAAARSPSERPPSDSRDLSGDAATLASEPSGSDMAGAADAGQLVAPVSPPAAPEDAGAAPAIPPEMFGPADAARAAAVVLVRSALSGEAPGSRPHGTAAQPAERYVDLAVAESVDAVGEVTVVTVATVIAEGAGGEWLTARLARFAVPLRVKDGSVTPLGLPWALPSPDARVEEPAWEPLMTDELAAVSPGAVAALANAGYADAEVIGLARAPALPGVLRAQVTARAPGEQAGTTHSVWLIEQPELHVLGAVPAAGPPTDDGSDPGPPAAPLGGAGESDAPPAPAPDAGGAAP